MDINDNSSKSGIDELQPIINRSYEGSDSNTGIKEDEMILPQGIHIVTKNTKTVLHVWLPKIIYKEGTINIHSSFHEHEVTTL